MTFFLSDSAVWPSRLDDGLHPLPSFVLLMRSGFWVMSLQAIIRLDNNIKDARAINNYLNFPSYLFFFSTLVSMTKIGARKAIWVSIMAIRVTCFQEKGGGSFEGCCLVFLLGVGRFLGAHHPTTRLSCFS